MSMGKRKRDRQPAMWVTATNLPTAASHPFYRRLADAGLVNGKSKRIGSGETDGHQYTVVWRFAHNCAKWINLFCNTQPLGNVSRDGRFFSSTRIGMKNWVSQAMEHQTVPFSSSKLN
jgi:hypothetical protein